MNTVQEIIFALGLFIGAGLFHKTQPLLLKGLLATLLISIVTAYLSSNSTVITIFYLLFAIVSLTYAVYNALQRKWLYVVIAAFAIFYYLFTTFQWPEFGLLLFSMLIPLICYLIILKNWRSHLSDLGTLTVLASSELIWLINYFKLVI